MLYWLEVLIRPISTFEKTKASKKALINIIAISLVLGFIQYLTITKLLDSFYIEELNNLPENFPIPLLVAVVTGFQILVTFLNILIFSLLFKILSSFLFKELRFKTILFILLFSQIPISLGVLANSFYFEATNSGVLLSIFGLGYLFSHFTDNYIILIFINKFEFFHIWSVLIIASGIYVYSEKYKFFRTFLIVFFTYTLFNTITSLIL